MTAKPKVSSHSFFSTRVCGTLGRCRAKLMSSDVSCPRGKTRHPSLFLGFVIYSCCLVLGGWFCLSGVLFLRANGAYWLFQLTCSSSSIQASHRPCCIATSSSSNNLTTTVVGCCLEFLVSRCHATSTNVSTLPAQNCLAAVLGC